VEGILDAGDVEGYTEAVRDQGKAIRSLSQSAIAGWRWCLPKKGTTLRQAADVVTKFLRDNPQLRHAGAPVLVAKAIHEVWPCPH
jgi:hypothetical protein